MTDGPLTFHVHLTEADVLAAYRLHRRTAPAWRWLFRILVLAIALELVLGVWLYLNGGAWRLPLIVVVLAVAVILLDRLVIFPRRIRRIYREQRALQLPWTVAVTDRGMESRSELGEGTTPWDMVIGWTQDADMILLYQSRVLFHMIPKRVFESPAQLDDALALLRKRVRRET